MKAIKKELDRLVQEASRGKRCRICGKNAEATHHILPRSNKITRYDLCNLMFICCDCHRMIHDGKLNQWLYIDDLRKDYLREVNKMNYKDFLLFVAQMTDDEYLRDCRKRLKKFIGEQNEKR